MYRWSSPDNNSIVIHIHKASSMVLQTSKNDPVPRPPPMKSIKTKRENEKMWGWRAGSCSSCLVRESYMPGTGRGKHTSGRVLMSLLFRASRKGSLSLFLLERFFSILWMTYTEPSNIKPRASWDVMTYDLMRAFVSLDVRTSHLRGPGASDWERERAQEHTPHARPAACSAVRCVELG